MTDHTDPVVSSGGFCSPSDEFFKPREIPGTTDELTLSWDGNVTAARERAELYRTNGRRLRGHRADLEADAWHNVATMVRSLSGLELLPDLLERFAQTQDNLIPTLPRKTVERRRARANAYVYHLAALELRICLGGGGPTPDPDAPPVYVPPEGHVAPVRGEDVADGWEGRWVTEGGLWRSAVVCRNMPTYLFEVRRVPAPEPATEWVPLTKLVGRTIKGETVKVHAAEISTHCDPRWWALHDLAMDHRAFLDGTLNPDTAEVLVLAEGER